MTLGFHEKHVLVHYLNKDKIYLIGNYKNENTLASNDVVLIDTETGKQINIELKARTNKVDCFNDSKIINMKHESHVIVIVTSDKNALKYEDYKYLENITLEKVNNWYKNFIHNNFKKLGLNNFTTVDKNYDDE